MAVFLLYLFYFGVVLGVAVFFHELGHFLAAKWMGVRVVRFSVGFGPKLFAWTYNGTEYQLAAIPMGGFVKMAGDNPEEVLEGRTDEFLSVSPARRIVIVVAGPLANIVTALACFMLIGMFRGEPYRPYNTVDMVYDQSPAARAGLMPDDVIVGARGEEIEDFEQIYALVYPRPGDPDHPTISLEVERADPQHPQGAVRETLELVLDEPLADYRESYTPPRVFKVMPGSPAQAAGLASGDLIVSVSGVPVESAGGVGALIKPLVRSGDDGGHEALPVEVVWLRGDDEEHRSILRPNVIDWPIGNGNTVPAAQIGVQWDRTLRDMISPRLSLPRAGVDIRWPAEVGRVAMRSPAAKAGIRRGDKLISIDGQLVRSFADAMEAIWGAVEGADDGRVMAKEVEVSWRNAEGEVKQAQVQLNREQMPASLGSSEHIWIGSLGIDPPSGFHQLGLVAAMGYSLNQTWYWTETFGVLLYQMVRGEVNTQHLAGPVGIARISGDMGRKGWDELARLIGLICVNLALLNLLPIPILDGGHILLYTIEAIRRKPWTVRQLSFVTYLGLIPILCLFALVFYNDIRRLVVDMLF